MKHLHHIRIDFECQECAPSLHHAGTGSGRNRIPDKKAPAVVGESLSLSEIYVSELVFHAQHEGASRHSVGALAHVRMVFDLVALIRQIVHC